MDRKISALKRPHVSGYMADSNISTLECGLEKLRIRVGGSRIQKEIVEDSVISGAPANGAYEFVVAFVL